MRKEWVGENVGGRFAGVMTCLLLACAPASGAVLSLAGGPSGGSVVAGLQIDLTVGLEPNGADTSRLVSHFLSVGLHGLVVQDGSLGTVYDGLAPFDGISGDLLDSSFEIDCSLPGACLPEIEAVPYASEWLSSAVLLPPAVTQGPGTLFTLRLTAAPGATTWALDVFGDEASALLIEPVPCPLDDADCVATQSPVPFTIVRADAGVPTGTARVTVGLTIRQPDPDPDPDPDPEPLPEPAAAVLLACACALRLLRIRRA